MKFEDITSVMAALAVHLSTPALTIPIFREGQKRDKEKYPFGSYNVLVLNQDAEQSASVFHVPVDNVSFDKVTRKNQRTSLSLNFLHEKSLPTITDLAERAMDWFDSEEGMKACEAFGITPQLISGDVQNRTAVIDNAFYEYKVGFDVLLQARKTTTKPTPTMAPGSTVTNLEAI